MGDSLTHGSSGDWTWRYRLWQHLIGHSADVDFVGPRDDVHGLGPDGAGSQAYVDPGFDRDHAASWGLSYAFPNVSIEKLVAEYRPDVVVVMLGVNDLIWLGLSPEEVLQLARDFITKARMTDPGVAIVVSKIPESWVDGAPRYNEMLDVAAAELDTDQSPVRVARSDVGFDLREDTWDPAHPNSSGEIVLAGAVADALSSIGIGVPFARPLPKVKRGPRSAPPLRG